MKSRRPLRGPAIRPDDREQLQPLLDTAISEADLKHHAESVQAALILHGDVETREAQGKEWAQRVLTACAREGVRMLVLARQSEDRGKILLSHSGLVVSMPTRVGIRRKAQRQAGRRQIQRPLWWELEWDEFEAYLTMRESARDLLSTEIAALHEVRLLRKRYPDSRTVADACALDGKDPRSFGITATGGTP